MSAFPTTSPPNVTEIRTYLIFWMGNISSDIIDTTTLDQIIQNEITLRTNATTCQITYYSAVSALQWIKRTLFHDNLDGGGGQLVEVEESEGDVAIERHYSETATASAPTLNNLLGDLLANPDLIGCSPFTGVDRGVDTGNVVVGGADENGYEATFRARTSFGEAIFDDRVRRNSRFGTGRFGNRRLF